MAGRSWGKVSARLMVAAALLGGLSTGAGHAARDVETDARAGVSEELVVFETANCLYCQVFRRDVLPDYLKSRRQQAMPIRFVDLNAPGVRALPLASTVTTVPTAVVLRDGEEIGRIPGYTGPEMFFQMISYIAGPVD